MKLKDELLGEIRYAIRLYQRQARLYRHLQTLGVFLSVLGGSAVISATSQLFPAWAPPIGGLLLAIAAAGLIATRPADKAAANEMDVKRYQALMAKAVIMPAEQLAIALEETRQSDVPEIEGLRNVAYNDVVREINREDEAIKLSGVEKFLGFIA